MTINPKVTVKLRLADWQKVVACLRGSSSPMMVALGHSIKAELADKPQVKTAVRKAKEETEAAKGISEAFSGD